MSPCEDGSGKPATGMKLTPRWPHTAFSCTTEGWAWARTRGGSVSYMCRIPAAGEQSGVATISCETYGRTTCTPLVCIHTVTEYRTGWLGMRECHPTARRITTISVATWECPVARASRFIQPQLSDSAHVKKTSFESVSAQKVARISGKLPVRALGRLRRQPAR